MGTTGSSGPRRPSPWVTHVALVLLCLIWGSTWLVIKEGLEDLPPLTSAGVRFVVAALVFAAIAPWLRSREGGAAPPAWLTFVMGTLNFGVSYGIVYWAETVIPSGLTSVLWGVFPIMMGIAGHFFLPGERLTPRHAAGFLIGFGGVVLLFLTDLRDIGPDAMRMGAIVLLSPLATAVANTVVKKHGGHVSSVLLNRNSLAVCAVVLCAAALLFERGASIEWTTPAITSVVYLAIAGTVVTFGLYFWLLRFAPASTMSLIAYVIPGVALALGWGFGGEAVTLHTVAGAGLILAGVTMAIKRR